MLTRRRFCQDFLKGGLPLFALNHLHPMRPFASPAAQRGAQAFDLLIRGGTVIDPAANLHARVDVAIRNGKIAEVSRDISPDRARQVISAQNKIVTPGLIDIHAHIYDGVGTGASNPKANADRDCLAKGVTTVVDAGSAGYGALAPMIKYVVRTSSARVYALVDIAPLGSVGGTRGAMEKFEYLNPQLTAQEARDNRPTVVGIKVRLSKNITGSKDLEGLKLSLEAAEASNLPLMVHIGDSYSSLKEILRMLRKGDVITHCYHGDPHGVLDSAGKILPEVQEARQRGILFDVGDHLNFDVTEKCLQQTFLPDTISTDLSARQLQGPVFDLPTMLSSFLCLGLDLDDVIRMATINAAHVFDFGLELGTLRPGREADIAIFELREGTVVFMDDDGGKRTGNQKLIPVAVFRSGKCFLGCK